MGYFLLLIAVLLALTATALFFYGAWVLIRHPHEVRAHLRRLAQALLLTRDPRNPLIEPGERDWETQGVFNPAAVVLDGITHLFYRAVGKDGISRVGYAQSKGDGSFSRLPYPVFALSEEGADAAFKRAKVMARHEALVRSGGSWSGTEDPRTVIIDDRLYLTYSAFGGWDSLRIGVSSLSIEDLRQGRWQWTPPVYLSPTGQVHKNWVIFPEKISGKYAVLHSLHSGSRDRVCIDYLDTLDEEASIESPYGPTTHDTAWDSVQRGVGPPPLKTPQGWLVLYHAIDKREPSRYKLGAMLLDLTDPSRVIAKSNGPVLAPDERYENEGAKPGIVYACGATLDGDTLTIYYGGADYVICAARHSLEMLLSHLLRPASPEPRPAIPLGGIPIFS